MTPIVLSSRFARATFDAATGDLIDLRRDKSSPNVLSAIYCWHLDGGTTTSERPQVNEVAFRTIKVRTRRNAVESVIASDRVRIRRWFELGPRDAVVRCGYIVIASSRTKFLERGVFPHVEFADDFADAYEDERDLYHDGAELGGGRELPCWRVFFRKREDAGAILIARSKEQMSHVQIESSSFDLRPHVRVNYSTNYELPRKPIPFARIWSYTIEFEIGPWQRKDHAAITRAAKLGEARRVEGSKPPSGKPGRKPAGKVFYAHRFASRRDASARFSSDKWMIVRVPWAQQGKAVFAGTGVRVRRPIVLRPKLPKGSYRMFIGVGNATGAMYQIDGEPEVTFRMLAVADRKKLARGTFDLALSGRHQARELECGVVELDLRKKITLHRWPDLHDVSMLDYVRFQPVTQSSRPHATRKQTLLAGMADAPDMAPLVDPLDPSPQAPRSVIWEHARCGYSKVYWRIDGQCSDYPSKINTMRYPSARVHGMFYAPGKVYGRMLRRFDLLQTVVDAGKEYGVEIWGWMRFNSYAGNVQSDFFKQHREYHETWETGSRASKLCLAFPEVRKHKIDILIEAAKYGLAGVNLGFLRHAPVLHRAPILVDGYRKLYGAEPPLTLDKDDPTFRFGLPPMDAEHVRWWKYRAQFLTQFGRELRAALREADLLHVKVSVWLRPQHHLHDGIDLDDWLAENLCDEVVAGAGTYVDEPLPAAEPLPEWRRKVQAKVPLLRSIWAHDLPFAKANAKRYLDDEGYAGLSTYESNAAVLDPEYIEFYRSLRG